MTMCCNVPHARVRVGTTENVPHLHRLRPRFSMSSAVMDGALPVTRTSVSASPAAHASPLQRDSHSAVLRPSASGPSITTIGLPGHAEAPMPRSRCASAEPRWHSRGEAPVPRPAAGDATTQQLALDASRVRAGCEARRCRITWPRSCQSVI
eukprot:scaffold6361_cov132-Isochrysis_galbana.AAC.7